MDKELLRPKTLAEYIGQDGIKEVLQTAIDAAKARKEPLDHVLLNGPPGLGKTTLGMIIAREMGWRFYGLIGNRLGKEVGTLLYRQPNRTIVFIDEIHNTRKPIQEILYPILEDNKTAEGIECNALTIIGATTNIGKLQQPFSDRFGLQFQLVYYTDAELSVILQISAGKLNVCLDAEATLLTAQRSRGTPRIANNLLKRIRDFAQVDGIAVVDRDFALNVLWNKLGVDSLGLQALDRQYLQILAESDGSTGIRTLASTMRQDVDTLESFIEPFLLSKGLVEREKTGRYITEAGIAHLREAGQ